MPPLSHPKTLNMRTVERAENVSPSDLPDFLPSRPLFSSHFLDGNAIVLQHYQHPPGRVEVPGLLDHLVVAHLTGPVLIDDEFSDGKRDRRWSDIGQVSITPAAIAQSRTFKGRTDAVLVHIPPALLNQVAREVYNVEKDQVALARRLAIADDALSRLVQALSAELQAGGPGGDLMADLIGRAIALHLLRYHSNLATAAADGLTKIARGRLRRVLDYMHVHSHEALSLPELASLSGLSQSQFARGFRETTGLSPHRFLSDLRIERAQHLLERTEKPVTEIALECGFVQPSHFATMFRKRVGMSPRSWRATRRW
jgi:AraC family transcriptional regulator